MLTERLNRTVIALLGAGLVIITGLLDQAQAFAGIDFNTIALLTGMMIIVAIARTTGVFEFVAVWSAKRVRAHPLGILIMLSVVTAVFSALLDNLTTVLLVVPVVLLIVDKLQLDPFPFLVSQILASNIGGTATLIGDPPNILIGSATGLTFVDFLFELGPVALVVLILVCGIFYLLWGKSLKAAPELRQRVMGFSARDSITDHRLMWKSLGVLGLVIIGFIVGEPFNIRPGTTAMFGASVLLLLVGLGQDSSRQSLRLRDAFGEVEWSALFFFMGLFVIVHGVAESGMLGLLGQKLIAATGGDPAKTAYAILWLSALTSTAVDNIPFVATMIPLIDSMAGSFGGPEMMTPIWWSLALGACLGGNGSLIGAAANIMVAGLAERTENPIGFFRFFLFGFPIMLMSIGVAHLYLYLRHFS